eukprot:1048196-Pelagomonas_calceolata.AAC.18
MPKAAHTFIPPFTLHMQVVGFVAGVLSTNAFTAAVASAMPPTLSFLVKQLACLAAGMQHKLPQHSRGEPTVIKSSSDGAAKTVSPCCAPLPALTVPSANKENAWRTITCCLD